jgi:hypothetical protein
MKLCEEQHTLRIGTEHDKLKGLSEEEASLKIVEMRKDLEAKYAIYIGNALKQWRNRQVIMAHRLFFIFLFV